MRSLRPVLDGKLKAVALWLRQDAEGESINHASQA